MPSRIELYILKAFIYNKDLYKEYKSLLIIPKEAVEVKTLFFSLEALYEKFPNESHNVDSLEAMVYVCYPNLRDVQKEALSGLLDEIRLLEVKDELVLNLVKQLQTRSQAQDIAMDAIHVSEGRVGPESLLKRLEGFKANLAVADDATQDSRNFVTDDLEILESHTIKGEGLSWRLDCLNRSLGPLRVGDFGFIFARPESGKTTFLADQCTYMAGQAPDGRPVVWFNNEEQGEKVRLRTYQAALGITQDEIWQDRQATQDAYRKITKGNLLIYDDASIHRGDVERIIHRLNPILVVFDQIDKIKGFNADRPDLVYGRIYQWARELAKSKCAIIGVCQADGTGEGVKWLTMGHVSDAKTAKQAEADWILGIGKSNEGGTEDVRCLNISKNKLLGDENTDPSERHGRFEVFIRPTIARYEDLY